MVFALRVLAWPARLALWFLGLACLAATFGAFITHGVAWQSLTMLLATGACFEARRALP